MKPNYQKELEKILAVKENMGKTLFLHSCCAPCSSYVLIYLRQYFRITVFYYNPNITENLEYQKRLEEQKRLIRVLNKEAGFEAEGAVGEKELTNKVNAYPVCIQEGDYRPQRFLQMAKGMEACPEGGERCRACYSLRLLETAKRAAAQKFDYFTTTLTISPLKNAQWLNEIGGQMGEKYGILFLPSDFKKKEGYKQSIELSHKYDLYRQDYCGCIYSRAERDARLRQSSDK